ncbi:hypothetical protein GCM10023323_17180 [Streptomyces thinghirensis]|uniref:Uncharacterized protein n=1 Tax=Streptomyces thinghirensis TaxID=551547 RepID=A0ABP9T241_9ACTN
MPPARPSAPDPDRRSLLHAALKPHAGSAPVTRASGRKRVVDRRFVMNSRLMHAGFLQAFSGPLYLFIGPAARTRT